MRLWTVLGRLDGEISPPWALVFDTTQYVLSCVPGFDCRCGNLFCGLHRYSDKHNCPYDYKAEAADKIRKENPVVVADKIQRIWGLRLTLNTGSNGL